MAKGPNLAPLLATTSGNTGPSSSSGYQGSFLLRPGVALCCGVGVLLITAGFFYWEIAALEHAIAVFPPAFLLLPLSGIGALAVLLPMFVFLCFRVSLFCCLLLWLPPTPKPNLTDRRNQPNSFSPPPRSTTQLSPQGDFENTNILFPSHYAYVFRRTYASLAQNNGKVSKKTL